MIILRCVLLCRAKKKDTGELISVAAFIDYLKSRG